MRKIVIAGMLGVSMSAFAALDPIVNDFWDTTHYVNHVPNEQAGVATSVAVDSTPYSSAISAVCEVFYTVGGFIFRIF